MQWDYEPSKELECSLIERLRHFPREPEMSIYAMRSSAALAVRTFLRFYHRFTIHGKDNLPTSGPFVLVCNHSSHLDAFCLLSALPLRRLHNTFPAAAADYFFTGMTRLGLSSVFLNAIPFQRQANASHSISLCRALLTHPKNVLILFPEGTRSATGDIAPFKAGVGLVTAETNVPVVPCRLTGTFQALSKRAWFPKPYRIHLHIGKPHCFADVPCNKTGAQHIADVLHRATVTLF